MVLLFMVGGASVGIGFGLGGQASEEFRLSSQERLRLFGLRLQARLADFGLTKPHAKWALRA